MRSILMFLFAAVMAQGCASAPSPVRRGPSKVAPPPPMMMVAASVAPTMSQPSETHVVEEPPAPPEVATTDRDLAVAWMVRFMSRQAPPGRQTFYAEAQETKDEALARYHDIANAIIDVVYDPNTKPLFGGASGRARTSSVVLAVMLHESGFMKNVDYGVGKFGRGDHGNSWCLLQLNVGSQGTGRTIKWNVKEDRSVRYDGFTADIFQGNTGPELVADRRVCVREGLKAMRISFRACQTMQLPLEQKLRVFASGNCEDGEDKSQARMKTAIKFWDDSKAERTFSDKAIVALVAESRRQQAEPPAPRPVPLPVPTKEDEKKSVQSLARTE